MDVKDEFFDDVEQNEAPVSETNTDLPFPAEDYNKQGKLKKVRGRVLKKLLRAEIKFYLPIMLTIIVLLVVSGIFFAFSLRAVLGSEYVENVKDTLAIASGLIFVFSCVGGLAFSQAYPVTRYNKNFFHGEGYLTFSLPVSMEEHVLAKRLGAIICTLLLGGVTLVMISFVVAVNGGFPSLWEAIKEIFSADPVHLTFFMIELFLSTVVGLTLIPSLCGAVSCAFSKFSAKKKTGVSIVLVFLGVSLVEGLFSCLISSGLALFPDTLVGVHIMFVGSILLQAALAVGCIFFEIWYLKNKLDLQ